MSTPENPNQEKPHPELTLPPLSDKETAFLIRSMWTSLQAPGWTFKNRKDLEKLGEAIFSGKTLKQLDDDLYDRLFPHLVKVAQCLGDILRISSPEESPAPSPKAVSPAPPPAEGEPSQAAQPTLSVVPPQKTEQSSAPEEQTRG